MKKEIVFLASLVAVAAGAQTFPAASVGLDSGAGNAPIFYLAPGTLAPSGTEVYVEILARPDALTPFATVDSMSVTKNTVYYDSSTAGGAYYFYDGAVTVPGVTPGATADFQVRAWAGAATFAAATIKAESPIITQVTGNWTASTSPPPDVALNFAQGLTMTEIVPEPTTIALLALGGAALFFRRRQ